MGRLIQADILLGFTNDLIVKLTKYKNLVKKHRQKRGPSMVSERRDSPILHGTHTIPLFPNNCPELSDHISSAGGKLKIDHY